MLIQIPIDLPTFIFAIIIAALAIFLFVYLPYRNDKQPEVSDLTAIKDGKDAAEQCEQFHLSVWKKLTREEMFSIRFIYYCPVCDRYRE